MSLRVAMVGAGYFAQFQLEGWRDVDTPVVAVCDNNPSRARELADRFQIGATFENAVAMLDEVQPDLLDLVLPPAAQAAVVFAAPERGVPTIFQKPFGLDLAPARPMH